MELNEMYEELGISEKVLKFGTEIEESLKERFEAIDKNAEYNQMKVLKAMQEARVSDIHFAATTGYGYNDLGRDTLEEVYAKAFHGEDALVRPQLISGTHALHVALSSNLRPGDELLSPVGKPYDTLEEVIGIRESAGSLKEYGVIYRQVDLLEDGSFDYENIRIPRLGILGKAVQHLHQKFLLRNGKQVIRHTTHCIFLASKRLDLKSDVRKDLHVLLQHQRLPASQSQDNGRMDLLTGILSGF